MVLTHFKNDYHTYWQKDRLNFTISLVAVYSVCGMKQETNRKVTFYTQYGWLKSYLLRFNGLLYIKHILFNTSSGQNASTSRCKLNQFTYILLTCISSAVHCSLLSGSGETLIWSDCRCWGFRPTRHCSDSTLKFTTPGSVDGIPVNWWQKSHSRMILWKHYKLKVPGNIII